VAQGGGEQTGAAAMAGDIVAAAAFLPEPLGQREAVCPLAGVVDGVRDVDPTLDRDAVEPAAAGEQQGSDLRIGVAFVPQRAREDRRAVLVAGEAQRAGGVNHLRLAARPVILDQLELEATGCLVVTDDFEHRRLFLIAEVEAILEQRRAGRRRCVDGDDHPRVGKVVGRGSGPLQGATERDQHALRRWQRAGRLALQLCLEPGEQGLERERQFDFRLPAALHGKHLIEQRAPDAGQVLTG
jgi:hypothetical protein